MNEQIPNFRRVNEWFYRGSQPSEVSYSRLADLGIRTVVCLRSSKKVVVAEEKMARQAGLSFVSIPMTYLPGPTYKDIRQFFSIIENEKNKPIFLHCWQGCDRTGLLVALYRIIKEQWSVDEAYQEMKACGFHAFYVHHFKWILYGYAWMLKTKMIDDSMA